MGIAANGLIEPSSVRLASERRESPGGGHVSRLWTGIRNRLASTSETGSERMIASGESIGKEGSHHISYQSKSAETTQSILKAARQLFSSPGYTSARVADIAKLAGVSRATVYNSVGDKRTILNELVRRYMAGYEEIGLRVQQAAKPTDTVFGLLGTMLRDTLMWRISNADLRSAIEVAKQLPDSVWTEANLMADLAIHGWLAKIHRASSLHGITIPEIDIEFASAALYSMIDVTISSFDVHTPAQEIDRIAHQLTLLQWHAIYCIPPSESPLIEDVLADLN